MPYVTVGQENSNPIDLYYEDHGSGQLVVLIHGYPLNGRSWERQQRVLLDAGYRVVAYDRRGFGRSSAPTTGYDYDTFTADLDALLQHLDARDVILGGFSMGTGEVTRYLSTRGSERVQKGMLFGAIPPMLFNTSGDNPEGLDRSVLGDLQSRCYADRPAWFRFFLDNFYNVDRLMPSRISEQAWQASFADALQMSPYAAYACIETWATDFRADLPRIDIPMLLVHGTEDRILPFDNTARRLPALISNLDFTTIEGGPHNVGWTFPDELNRAMMDFLAK